ncbi:hypothetical protein CBS101457_005151 [Exobasidium rhododendri]|nr:hypothetical protein CBS101457_005151 [Exobasidium rhododendri]
MTTHSKFVPLESYRRSHPERNDEMSYLRVMLQVAGIHCPSCVSHVTKLLQSMDLPMNLDSISVSFLDHTVLFHLPCHQQSPVNGLEREQEDTLKKIVSVLIQQGFPPNAIGCKRINSQVANGVDAHTRTVVPFELEAGEGEKGESSATAGTIRGDGEKWSLWSRLSHPFEYAKARAARQERLRKWECHLEVCLSCREASISSVQSSKSITFEDVVDDDVNLDSQQGLDPPADTHWRATYSVGGMTCASCVSNVEKAVKSSVEGLLSFSVALMQGSATASFSAATLSEAQKTGESIGECIEDAGYDCTLEELRQEEEKNREARSDRTVRIKVDGMFCSHCVSKLQQYFSEKTDIKVNDSDLTALTLASPSITINYTPSHMTTLRSILADIGAINPRFEATIVTPPSVSTRSSLHARKELHALFTRLVVAFLFVPPTLLIAVVAPTFLPAAHPLRVSLSRPIVGEATKGDIILWTLATPVQFGVGQVFYQRAFKSLRSVWRQGRSWKDRLISWGDMNVLVALGTSVAYFASLAFLIVDMTRSEMAREMTGNMTYFDACVFLVFFILCGRVLEAWSKRKTTSAVSALGSLRPSSGLLLLEPDLLLSSAVATLEVELLEVGDLVLVPSGASPPLDSTLVATPTNPTATFLESAISGEAKPVIKRDGDQLYAGTVNQTQSAIIARVQTVAGCNLIDSVIEIVQSSSSKKADVEQLADKVTSHFVPLIVLLAVLVLAIWVAVLYSPGLVSEQWKEKHIRNYFQSGSRFLYALQFAVSVLVVACPCGIGLAAPTAQIIAIGLASKQGILVQGGGQAFQSAVQFSKRNSPKAFVFDKTGTITHGSEGSVSEAHFESLPSDAWTKEALCKAVWLMEGNSGHPISAGIRTWCEQSTLDSATVEIEQVDEVTGRGLKGVARLRESRINLLIGSLAFLQDQSADQFSLSDACRDKVTAWQGQGASVVLVAASKVDEEEALPCKLVFMLALADTVRGEAMPTIDHLKRKLCGQIWMVSGDTLQTAKAIASQVGIAESNVVAGVLPAGKADWIEKIKQISDDPGHDHESQDAKNKRLVAFVGDGINDAPALSSADLSIALGSGSSLATSTASFILLNSERPLASIPAIISLSRATQSKIWQNLAWACAFNVVFIPIAAGAFVQKGFTFGPSWSGLAMALSSVSVVLNALTLRFWRAPEL